MRRSIESWLSLLTTLHLVTWSHVTVLYLLLACSVYSAALISRPIDCPPNSRASRETPSDPLIFGVPVGFRINDAFLFNGGPPLFTASVDEDGSTVSSAILAVRWLSAYQHWP